MICGIDIGGTKIEVGVFDDAFVPVDRRRVATPQGDYDRFLAEVAALIADADARFPGIASIGIGMPGLVDADSRSLAANLPSATGQRIAVDLERRIGRRVVCDNDCRCFALSEATGGAADGFAVVFGAILGTGAAGGLVVNGTLIRGRQGIAGEYGHIPIPAALAARYDLPVLRCGCGLTGCYEGYVAGPGLVRMAARFGVAATDVPALSALWRAGDADALAVRECFFDLLGAVFATVAMTVDPDVIVLGGGVSLLDDLAADLPAAIGRHLFAGFDAPAVVTARFGDASGARGAAILSRQPA